MAEKQYYVRVTFEFGTDTDGTLTPKNTGEVLWNSMQQADVAGLQNYAVIPSLNMMSTRAGELGMAVAGIEMPDLDKVPPGQAKR
jgi:hypothetical protein